MSHGIWSCRESIPPSAVHNDALKSCSLTMFTTITRAHRSNSPHNDSHRSACDEPTCVRQRERYQLTAIFAGKVFEGSSTSARAWKPRVVLAFDVIVAHTGVHAGNPFRPIVIASAAARPIERASAWLVRLL